MDSVVRTRVNDLSRTEDWLEPRWRFVAPTTAYRYSTINGTTYKIASNRAEREAAFRLVHDTYTQAKLMEPNRYGMRVTPYHLLPTTEVFIAVQDNTVVCTVSLIGDGELGIPMESIYGDEVADLRNQGLHFGELSCLAHRRNQSSEILPTLTNLNGLICQYARYHAMDDLLIAVHPMHEKFYARLFGFRRFGVQKSYPLVGDRPAVAACHDFSRLDRDGYPLYEQTYRVTCSPWELLPQPMLEEDRIYFEPSTRLCASFVPMAA